MIANTANLVDITQDKLPISSISIFLIGFVVEVEPDQNDSLFKVVKLNITEFAGSLQGRPTGKTFYTRCRYLKSDRRIEKKAARIKKNSNLMITD